jgi:hypothetical protein
MFINFFLNRTISIPVDLISNRLNMRIDAFELLQYFTFKHIIRDFNHF